MAGSSVENQKKPEPVGAVLSRILAGVGAAHVAQVAGAGDGADARVPETAPLPGGRYDFDLAEFPLFSFHTTRRAARAREPLGYTDTIAGHDGTPVSRRWTAYPGAFGVGGASTQALLYDLLQLYLEQGGRGAQIQFGTLRALFLRRGQRNPSARDYARMRRDLDILRGYDFHCENAFWDHGRRAYVDMKWRLFGSVFFFKPHPDDPDRELPFGFVEVSSVLQEVARTRGFFALGFASELFHALKPLEQRLAVYLAKKFVSQRVHRRFAADLARALPIQAASPYEEVRLLRRTAAGLLAKGLPILAAYRLERSRDGRWLAEFERKAAPRQDRPRRQDGEFEPALAGPVARIIEAVGSDADRLWWAQCVRRLGPGAVDRALGLLKEARQSGGVRNPGGLLTRFFKDIAEEAGVVLR